MIYWAKKVSAESHLRAEESVRRSQLHRHVSWHQAGIADPPPIVFLFMHQRSAHFSDSYDRLVYRPDAQRSEQNKAGTVSFSLWGHFEPKETFLTSSNRNAVEKELTLAAKKRKFFCLCERRRDHGSSSPFFPLYCLNVDPAGSTGYPGFYGKKTRRWWTRPGEIHLCGRPKTWEP